MPDEPLTDDLESGLERALAAMQKLQTRIESGEEVTDAEMTELTRAVGAEVERVRARLESAVGNVDPVQMRAAMKERLTPSEFAEWLEGEEARVALRNELKHEEKH